MKKLFSLVLCLLLMLALAAYAAADVDPGQSIYCKYGSAESPCHYWFACNSSNQRHYCYCTAHTEDKEDKYAFVFMYGPVGCTLSGDVCTYCGHDYSPEFTATELLISSIQEAIEMGRDAFETSVSGDTLSVGFSEYIVAVMDENGVVSESLLVPTEYQLLLTGGSSYAYTGEPIEPAFLSVSEYGPGSLQDEYGLYMIDEISYTNNVNPGTATASVTFQFESPEGLILKELSVNFTIEGDGGSTGGGESGSAGETEPEPEYCKYGSESSPCNIVWSRDEDERTHSRVCTNHVEDKEDMYSYVLVSGPDACTLDENDECTVCGGSYGESGGGETGGEEEELIGGVSYDLFYEVYNYLLECGYDPIVMTIEDGKLFVSLNERFYPLYDERGASRGLAMPESMYVETEYSIVMESASYPYNGEAVEPASYIDRNEYGPGEMLEAGSALTIGGFQYANNNAPGTAQISADFKAASFGGYTTKTLSASFTITEPVPVPEWPLPNAKTLFLPAELTEVAYEAFAGVDAEVIVVPASCETVAYDAFAHCPNLQSVIFYGGDTEVNYAAFDGCGMITIFAPENSAVHQYALDMGYQYAPLSE